MIHLTSTIFSLLFTGRIGHILNPWHLYVDFNNITISVKKRNWFLISFDEQVVPFRYIRRIEIDTHLFGADLIIKVYGSGSLKVFSISKEGARNIRNQLINFNNQNKITGMVI